MAVDVKDDRREWDLLVKASIALAGAEIRLGIQGKEADEQHGESPYTVAQVAACHEFGLGVPERSFLRGWLEEEQEKVQRLLQKVLSQIMKGEIDAETGLERAGAMFVGWIQVRIANRIDPPLAPATIKRKRSDVPLIDTGVLRSSITYRVTFA